jgi:hypothetical protein
MNSCRPFARGVVRTEEEDSRFWRHDRAQPWVSTSCCTRAWTASRDPSHHGHRLPARSASGQSTTHTSSYDPETVTLTMRTCPPAQSAGQTARDAVGSMIPPQQQRLMNAPGSGCPVGGDLRLWMEGIRKEPRCRAKNDQRGVAPAPLCCLASPALRHVWWWMRLRSCSEQPRRGQRHYFSSRWQVHSSLLVSLSHSSSAYGV